MTDAQLLALACLAARQAGQAICDIYDRVEIAVVAKDDTSPLTAADLAAHDCIRQVLAPSGLPLLSEEGRSIDYAERRDWPAYWLIDPLDGTKEFLKRNGEFTVNIALMRQQRPVLGVIYVPVSQTLYWNEGHQAYKQQGEQTRHLQATNFDFSHAGLGVVASRSHRDAETEAFLASLSAPRILAMGSSLKFMLLAEGQAQLYPRFAPTMEWDTAAADAILAAAGGRILQMPERTPLAYNKPQLRNPSFLALGAGDLP